MTCVVPDPTKRQSLTEFANLAIRGWNFLLFSFFNSTFSIYLCVISRSGSEQISAGDLYVPVT